MKKGTYANAILAVFSFVIVISLTHPWSVNADNGWIVVTTKDDSDDGVCDNIHCSLREAINKANCRSSDYAESDYVDELLVGETAELIALNPEFTHGLFELDNGQCWSWLGLLDGPENPFGTCNVPIVDPLTALTETPLACSPDLDPDACELAGGYMSDTRTTAPICICPE